MPTREMANSSLTQMIDSEGDFVGDIDKWMVQRGLQNVGFDFSVVTVLGSQSSGKSTLLNCMFGTSFQVMDSQMGHSQTTKGLWIGSDNLGDKSTIIIDVEGNDSRERGEDGMTFEHRAALFSLALADCVVVNMWYMSLGNYTASSYGLLKTVMEVNLDLFLQEKGSPKTLLLFVVRDWTDQMTPLPRMESKIHREYIHHIWNSISKPEKLRNSSPEDFFDFEVVGLPHALMLPEQFAKAVKDLRERWNRRLRPSSYTRHIPSDGFGMYCSSIWETIKQQSQLDIPSQKAMLATFRCQELKNVVLMEMRTEIQEILVQARSAELPDFKPRAEVMVGKALVLYAETAGRYQEEVCAKVELELLESLFVELQKIVDSHLSHKQQQLGKQFTMKLEETFRATADDSETSATSRRICPQWKEFRRLCEDLQSEFSSAFEGAAVGCEISVKCGRSGTDVSRTFESRPDGLRTSMLKDVSRMRERQLTEFQATLRYFCSKGMESLQDMLVLKDYTKVSFVAAKTKILLAAKDDAVRELKEAWEGLQLNESLNESTEFEEICGVVAVKELRRVLEGITANLHQQIMARFEMLFQYDEDEQPRQWQTLTSDRLKQIFLNSKDRALDIVEGLRTVDIPMDQICSQKTIEAAGSALTLPLLEESKMSSIVHRSVRSMQNACRDAQYIQSTGGTSSWRNAPMWLWLVLLAFGWNELWMVLGWTLTNPFTFALLIPILLISVIAVVLGQTQVLVSSVTGCCLAVKTLLLPALLKSLVAAAEKLQEVISQYAITPITASAVGSPGHSGDPAGAGNRGRGPSQGAGGNGGPSQISGSSGGDGSGSSGGLSSYASGSNTPPLSSSDASEHKENSCTGGRGGRGGGGRGGGGNNVRKKRGNHS